VALGKLAIGLDGLRMTMVVVTHEMGGTPAAILRNPQQERTKAFLSKVL